MRNLEEWSSLSTAITDLIVNDYCCNDEQLRSVDLSAYKRLKRIEIRTHCFIFVKELIVDGLNELESVVIGDNTFSKSVFFVPAAYHVVFKDCPRLREVNVGCGSFIHDFAREDYGARVSEVIAVDSVTTVSDSFCYAKEEGSADYSKSRIDESCCAESGRDRPKPNRCSRVVFESD